MAFLLKSHWRVIRLNWSPDEHLRRIMLPLTHVKYLKLYVLFQNLNKCPSLVYLLWAVIRIPNKNTICRIVSARTLNRKARGTSHLSRFVASSGLRIKDQSGSALKLCWTSIDASDELWTLVGHFNVFKRIIGRTLKAIRVSNPNTSLGWFIKIRSILRTKSSYRLCVCAQKVRITIGHISHKIPERSSLADSRRNCLSQGKRDQETGRCKKC